MTTKKYVPTIKLCNAIDYKNTPSSEMGKRGGGVGWGGMVVLEPVKVIRIRNES